MCLILTFLHLLCITDWDLGVCLQYECKRKQLHKPDVLNSWIDLRCTYRVSGSSLALSFTPLFSFMLPHSWLCLETMQCISYFLDCFFYKTNYMLQLCKTHFKLPDM